MSLDDEIPWGPCRISSPSAQPMYAAARRWRDEALVVFEQFVRTALREAFDASLTDFPDNAADHQLYLDTDYRIRLEPDLGHHPKRTWAFIGDVKYKTDTGNGLSPDLYQLLAYATAADLPGATLIYADGPPQPGTHRVRHRHIELHIHHLELDQPPKHVVRDLGHLAAQLRAT